MWRCLHAFRSVWLLNLRPPQQLDSTNISRGRGTSAVWQGEVRHPSPAQQPVAVRNTSAIDWNRPNFPISELTTLYGSLGLTLDASQRESASWQFRVTTGLALGGNVCRRCHCGRNPRSTWMAQTQSAKVPSFPWPDDHKLQQATEQEASGPDLAL